MKGTQGPGQSENGSDTQQGVTQEDGQEGGPACDPDTRDEGEDRDGHLSFPETCCAFLGVTSGGVHQRPQSPTTRGEVRVKTQGHAFPVWPQPGFQVLKTFVVGLCLPVTSSGSPEHHCLAHMSISIPIGVGTSRGNKLAPYCRPLALVSLWA